MLRISGMIFATALLAYGAATTAGRADTLPPNLRLQLAKSCHLDSRCSAACWHRHKRREISYDEASRCQAACCRTED